MKNIVALSIAAWAATNLVCALPAQQATGQPALPAAGKVLLLKNQRILEGDIERDGPRYRIRRRIGESTVDVAQVEMLCESREHAYQHLRGLANLRDPDERIRLARWCQFHGLLEQGLHEARAALEMVPKHAEGLRLVRSFERTLCPTERSNEPVEESPVVMPEPEPEVVLTVPLNLNCLTQFNNRVQPILMNACASCHVSGRGGNFQLRRTFGQGGLHGKSTRSNVASAVNFIDFDRWQLSPLLVKAVGVHGGIDRPALEGKQVAAFQVLEEWVKQVVESSPRPGTPRLDPTPIARAPQANPPAELPAEVTAAKPEPKFEPIFASAAKPVEPVATEQQTPPQLVPLSQFQEPTPMPPAAQTLPGEGLKGNREIHAVSAASGQDSEKHASPSTFGTALRENGPAATPAVPAGTDTFASTFAVATPAEKQPQPPVQTEAATPDDPFDPVIFNRQMHGQPE